jgi:sugar O-acyltransferase (sialic acid O-acetyltransferase NeuD family)
VARIVIFGIGKVADVLYRHIAKTAKDEVVAFTVDAEYLPDAPEFHGKPVVAFEDVAKTFPPQRFSMMVAIGYHDLNAARREKYEQAKRAGYSLHSFVSPNACAGDWLAAGDNCIVLDNAVIEPGVTIASNVVVWSGALIGHHSTVEDHVWIAGQAVFGGSTRIGAQSFVGLGAIVGHEVEIGEKSFLGAGVLVTKCAGPKSVFIGPSTELFRLDSDRFLKISKLR